jgi:hypothetical protein
VAVNPGITDRSQPQATQKLRRPVRGTVANANAMAYRNGTAVGTGGASPGDLTLSLGALSSSTLSNQLTTLQYIGSLVSPMSKRFIVDCEPEAVVTQLRPLSKTGAYLREHALTRALVAARGMQVTFTAKLDSAAVRQRSMCGNCRASATPS